MKLVLISTLALLASTLALAPAAEARAFCVAGVDPWCPGVFCIYDQASRRWDCVPHDPWYCVQECPPESLRP